MKKEEFDSEKKHLSEVCEVLNNKINEMSEGIYSTDKSLQEFRRYMWENKGDMDVQELNSVRSSSEQEAKLLLDKQKYFLPSLSKLFKPGNFHLQELLFYRTQLEQNVSLRIKNYLQISNK